MVTQRFGNSTDSWEHALLSDEEQSNKLAEAMIRFGAYATERRVGPVSVLVAKALQWHIAGQLSDELLPYVGYYMDRHVNYRSIEDLATHPLVNKPIMVVDGYDNSQYTVTRSSDSELFTAYIWRRWQILRRDPQTQQLIKQPRESEMVANVGVVAMPIGTIAAFEQRLRLSGFMDTNLE